MTTPSRLVVARWLVEQRGLSVIPIEPKGKKPVIAWKPLQQSHPSLDDLEEWFVANPDRNVGIVTGAISSLVAVDCDSPAAIAWADAHLPTTEMRTRTSDGEHRFFRHPGVPVKNKVRIRTDGCELKLDVRGDGGYVVAPGSVHETGFVYSRAGSWPPVDELPVFDPAWIAEAPYTPLTTGEEPSVLVTGNADEFVQGEPPLSGAALSADHARVLARVREYLQHVPSAIEGQGGDTHTYRLCCKLVRGFALPKQDAFELLQPWNARCVPRWEDAELREKLRNALLCGDEPVGGRRDAPPPDHLTLEQEPFAESETERMPEWPTLHKDALVGLFGFLVGVFEGQTEAAPVALLGHGLVLWSNLIGRTPHVVVGSDAHHTNENVLVVGDTSSGRKGTALSDTRTVMRAVDPDWALTRVQSGVSSGEGLIYHVRDPREGQSAIKEKGRVTGYETVVEDAGVSDKRLCVIEPEFGRTLRVSRREGNTLSAAMRQAWDTGDLRVLTRNSPLVATSAHISIVGHITPHELRKEVRTTDLAGGLLNRFLLLLVRRGSPLPHGGSVDPKALNALVQRFHAATDAARRVTTIGRDDEANAYWAEQYPRLTRERAGLVGAICARAPAHVLRISLLYALADESSKIRLADLKAAIALWNYSEASTRWLFKQRIGHRLSDYLLALLRVHPAGLTRTQLSDALGRNRRADEIHEALQLLVEYGLVWSVKNPAQPGGGRPVVRWFAADFYEINEITSRRRDISFISSTTQRAETQKPVSSLSLGEPHGSRYQRPRTPAEHERRVPPHRRDPQHPAETDEPRPPLHADRTPRRPALQT